MFFGALFTLLAPIKNFMIAMFILFGINFVFGLLSARTNEEDWETKKALKFFVNCCVFFVTAAALFIIGHLMNEDEQALTVVKYICFVAIYVFTINILKNWRKMLVKDSDWYKYINLLYNILSVKFAENFSFAKKKRQEKVSTNTILDKDDN